MQFRPQCRHNIPNWMSPCYVSVRRACKGFHRGLAQLRPRDWTENSHPESHCAFLMLLQEAVSNQTPERVVESRTMQALQQQRGKVFWHAAAR